MASGFLEVELAYHKRQVELLTKDLQEREETGQRRITKLCKEHSEQMASLISSIEKHQEQVDVLEHQLSNVHHVA